MVIKQWRAFYHSIQRGIAPLNITLIENEKLFKVLRPAIVVCRWSITGFIFLLAIWIVGGNLLANQQKQKIEKQLNAYVEEGLANRPEYNDSALKLIALAAELGINLDGGVDTPIDTYMTRQLGFDASETDREEVTNMLDRYDVFEQALKVGDEMGPIPDEVRGYLEQNASIIATIQNHLVKSELPEWEVQKEFYTVLQAGNPWELPLPSRPGLANLQRLLLIKVVNDYQQGSLEAVQIGLEASWKLRQSLNEGRTFINQLVGIILGRQLLAVMRKVDVLSAEWQDELVEYDYRQFLRKTLEQELFVYYAGFTNNPVSLEYFGWLDEHLLFDSFIRTSLQLLSLVEQPIAKPYFTLSTIETFEIGMELLDLEENQSTCDPNFVSNIDASEKLSWWNFSAKDYAPFLFNQDFQTIEYMLEAELTQKVLQAKTIAAQTGQWPETLPNPESYLCPDRAWKYEVMPDDTMVITFEPKPDWLKQRMENDDSLTFQFQTRKLPTVQ